MNDLATSARGRIRGRRLLDARARVAAHDFLKWSADGGWVDRDGVAAPSPLLVVKVDEILRMWKDGQPTDISPSRCRIPMSSTPQIPVSEWEEGFDGRPVPPWAHYVVAYLVNPETATKYVYAAKTVGAHIAVEQLKENVITMRMLRGARVMPLVELGSKPMKTKFKMCERPDFRDRQLASAGRRWGHACRTVRATALPVLPAADAAAPGRSRRRTRSAAGRSRSKPPVNATLDAMGDVQAGDLGRNLGRLDPLVTGTHNNAEGRFCPPHFLQAGTWTHAQGHHRY